MRLRNNILSALVIFVVTVTSSCTRNGGSGSLPTADVLMSGYLESGTNTTAVYWRNSVRTILTKSAAKTTANDIAVSGQDIWVVGDSIAGTDSYAVYWKNGEMKTLGPKYSSAYGIFISGNDVYIVGRCAPGFQYNAALWKNGVLQVLPSDVNFPAIARDVTVVNNDVYVCGMSGGTTPSSHTATYWKNGAITVLPKSTGVSDAFCISVSNNNVYVGGFTTDAGTSHVIPTCWKNGTATSLAPNGIGDGVVYSLNTSGSSVYAAGSFSEIKAPALWKDGTLVPYTNGTQYFAAYGMAVSGSHIYLAGYGNFNSNGPNTSPYLWRNNSAEQIGTDKGRATAICFAP